MSETLNGGNDPSRAAVALGSSVVAVLLAIPGFVLFDEIRSSNSGMSRRQPDSTAYFEAKVTDRGCASSGLKDYERWSSGSNVLRADLDGDGRQDRVVEYQIGDYGDADQSPTEWLRAELATGVKVDHLYSWHYTAYRLEGSRIVKVDERGGSERRTRPRNVRWSPGLACDGVTDR